MTGIIDVLIPHFNDPPGLQRSVDSVRRQSWTGQFRLVVVDDGSRTEDQQRAQDTLRASGLPFTIDANTRNRGRPATRNRLLELTEAPYVAWLDAGDEWHPQKTALQMQCLKSVEADKTVDTARVWVTCDYDWHWDDGRKSVEVQKIGDDQLRALMEGQSLRAYLWTLIGTRDSMLRVGAFDPQLPRLQDLDFFLRFVASGGTLLKPQSPTAHPLCVYTKSDVGRNATEIHQCNVYLLEKHAALYSRYGRPFVKRRQLQALMLALRFARSNGDRALASKLLATALIRHPVAAGQFITRKLMGAR